MRRVRDFSVQFAYDGTGAVIGASGRIGWDDGLMYFHVERRGDGYQCWNCGDDVSPLSPNEAFANGDIAPSVWQALPADGRKFLMESACMSQNDLQALATSVFGSEERAAAWWAAPCMWLDHRRPADLALTAIGRGQLQEYLARVAHGTYT